LTGGGRASGTGRVRFAAILWLAACAPALAQPALAQPALAQPALAQLALCSPWQAAPAAAAPVAYKCSTPPDLPVSIDVSDYYTDAAHSIVSPARLAAYRAGVGALDKAVGRVVAMGDAARAPGGQAAAACALQWLGHFAAQGALTGAMPTNQAVYVQGWLLGALAVAALKAAPQAGGMPPPVATWLAAIAARTRAYFDPRLSKTDGRNNHRYWAGFAVMAAGIAADRRDLFDWGLASARIGLAQIQPDGTLPLEMARRGRALHYHLFAAAPLVMAAELALPNGIDLYAEQDGALPRLATRALDGLQDPGFFAARAGAPQEDASADNPGDVAWAAAYLSRFGLPVTLPPRALRAGTLYLGGRAPAAG
jgi:poly(beta-D-mannuronate) lyase